MTSQSTGLVFEERKIGEWDIPTPTIEFKDALCTLRVDVNGVIINSIVDGVRGKERQQNWKAQVASSVKRARGLQPWSASDEYAISLTMRFHLGNHGNRDLDAENFVKPIIDATAAGLFCDSQTQPQSIKHWGYDDSNFNTLLIHRLPDARTRADEGIAISVSARK